MTTDYKEKKLREFRYRYMGDPDGALAFLSSTIDELVGEKEELKSRATDQINALEQAELDLNEAGKNEYMRACGDIRDAINAL